MIRAMCAALRPLDTAFSATEGPFLQLKSRNRSNFRNPSLFPLRKNRTHHPSQRRTGPRKRTRPYFRRRRGRRRRNDHFLRRSPLRTSSPSRCKGRPGADEKCEGRRAEPRSGRGGSEGGREREVSFEGEARKRRKAHRIDTAINKAPFLRVRKDLVGGGDLRVTKLVKLAVEKRRKKRNRKERTSLKIASSPP
jgi:hypothetical protein